MVLWTIQPIDAWNVLQRSGVLRGDARFAETDFAAAYEWMAQQMRRRLRLRAPSNALPLWGWYQWEGERRRKPDLRSSGHLAPGELGVRIEFEMDENLVLLSDFGLWHYVLNYWNLPTSMAEGEAFETELAERGLSIHQTRPPSGSRFDRIIKESWNRIFDLEWVEEDIARSPAHKSIQATFWELTLESVARVDEFTAR